MKASQIKKAKLTKAFLKANVGNVIWITPEMYHLVKVNPLNREEGGIEKARLNEIISMMEKGVWLDTGNNIVTVNKKGELIDGTHRSQAYMLRNEPFMAYITGADKFNGSKIERFKGLTVLNSYDSKWKKDQTNNIAKKLKMPLAKRIDELKLELSSKSGLPINKISNSWIFALLQKDVKKFSASKELLLGATYDNPELLEYSKTAEFRKDFEAYTKLVRVTKDIQRFNNKLKAVLFAHWTYKGVFKIERMIKNSKHLLIESKEHKQVVQDAYNKGFRGSKYVALFKNCAIPAHKNANKLWELF